MRRLKFFQAIREGLSQALQEDPKVYLLGLGVPGPTGIFGTTDGLAEQFGSERVMDMPSSEGAMTGIALGSTTLGLRPVMIHMRGDFAILAMDQMVNQVAKWHFMYGGKLRAPMVFRMIVGRGWGQGPQHSQSLQAWFAHIPGLKVVTPSTPHDAKGMMLAAIRDDAPVVFFEHRWLYLTEGEVPEAPYEVALGEARIARPGRHLTIAASSYMVPESVRACEVLAELGIEGEVIDLRGIVPLDAEAIFRSVRKTGALIVADTGTIDFGISAEIVSRVAEQVHGDLKKAPRRIGLPFCPSPTSPSLAEPFFPRSWHIVKSAADMFGIDPSRVPLEPAGASRWHDTPHADYMGPY